MMSGKVVERGPEEAKAEVDELVGDVLQDIERALTPAPPRLAEPSIPPPRESEDHLAALAAQLVEEREEERRSLHASLPFMPTVSLDDAWASEDEAPTTEWQRQEAPPSAESLKAILRYIEVTHRETIAPDDDVTPRPAAVSVPALEEPPRRRIPVPLVAVALISIGAAIVSYRLGPHSAAADSIAPSHAAAARTVAAPAATAASPATVDYGAPVQTQRLLVTLAPADARLVVRTMDEPAGESYAGPWPRAFELAPGDYELVAFRDGLSIVSRVEIEPGVDPPPLTLRLPVAE